MSIMRIRDLHDSGDLAGGVERRRANILLFERSGYLKP
jgi:hypothetical protein